MKKVTYTYNHLKSIKIISKKEKWRRKNERYFTAQEKILGNMDQSEFERIELMKQDTEVKDFSKLDKIVVGILPGDGIGPIIMEQAVRVIKALIAG